MDHKDQLESDLLLETIFRYFSEISKEHDLNLVLERLSNLGREIVRAKRCSLWLLDKENEVIQTLVAHDVEKKLTVKAYAGLVGHAIKTGEELLINDPYNDVRFHKETDLETGFVTKCIIVIPIKNDKDEVIGAFQALNKIDGTGHFSQGDVARLRMVAAYSGKSIENAQLRIEMEETQKEIITLLAEASECRSLETGNHIKRVVAYAVLIAQKLGLSDEEISLLEFAAPMHDIGKVGIPDSILQKPGKLTEDEYEIIKTHSEIGYKILSRSSRPFIAAAATIARQHHERYDGQGYPLGLMGDEIHIFSKITSVCDVFDALASKRVYKEPWPVEEIFNLVKKEKGKQFDPVVAQALLDCKDEIYKIYQQIKD